MSSAALFDKCHELVAAIAPEVKPYIEDADLFRDMPCDRGDTLGWADTSALMDRNIADRLGARYTGPRQLVVLDADKIAADAQPGAFERCLLGVCVHEVAHVVPAKTICEPKDTPYVREYQKARMATDFTTPQPEPTNCRNSHDLAFVRRACHLFYRAVTSGFDVAAHRLFGPMDWMGPAEIYIVEMLAECARMKDATFAEIQSTDPPVALVERWERDLRWYERYYRGTK